MNVEKILRLTDNLVFAKTEKHLDNLQEAILRGTLQREKYSQIAEDCYCSEGHVKDVGYQLWKLLSEVIGEEIKKSNFRSAIERLQSCDVSIVEQNFVRIGQFSVATKTPFPPDLPYPPSIAAPKAIADRLHPRYDDLGEAPDLMSFYGREEELATLKHWILSDRARLVVLRGLSGIGKTALAVQLLQQIKDKFDGVVWRTLRYSPSLEALETNLLQVFSGDRAMDFSLNSGDRRSVLFERLRSHRCLIVLDDFHSLLSRGQLAGHYPCGYENYGLFFKQIAELSHNSCLLLLTWEPPREIPSLKGDRTPVRTLHLGSLGVAARHILLENGLKDEGYFSVSIERYGGNPLWLKLASNLIHDLFNGKVSEWLQYEPLFLCEDLKAVLQQQCDRLSKIERVALSALADRSDPVAISTLLESVTLSPSELLNALQSLGRRSLVEKERSRFFLLPVLRQYLKFQDSRKLE